MGTFIEKAPTYNPELIRQANYIRDQKILSERTQDRLTQKMFSYDSLDKQIMLDNEIHVQTPKDHQDFHSPLVSPEEQSLMDMNAKEIRRLKLEIQAQKEIQNDLCRVNLNSNIRRMHYYKDIKDVTMRKELQRKENFIEKNYEQEVNLAWKHKKESEWSQLPSHKKESEGSKLPSSKF